MKELFGQGHSDPPGPQRRQPGGNPEAAPAERVLQPSDERTIATPPRFTAEQEAELLGKFRRAKLQRQSKKATRAAVNYGLAAVVGLALGAGVTVLLTADQPIERARITLASWLLPDPLRERVFAADEIEPAAVSPKAEQSAGTEVGSEKVPPPVEDLAIDALEEQVSEVEARLLAMLQTSSWALAQLQDVDRVRMQEIDRMAPGSVAFSPEAQIVQMISASGALDQTLGSIGTAAPAGGSPLVQPARSGPEAVGLTDTEALFQRLASLEDVRAQLIAELNEAPAATRERRSVVDAERGLNDLLAYTEAVGRLIADEPAAARGLPVPDFDGLEAVAESTADPAFGALLARTRDLYAKVVQ